MKIFKHVGFKALIAVTMRATIFWDMMLCSLAEAHLVYSLSLKMKTIHSSEKLMNFY
jgi:hypothetical protein